jgi:putative addiction module component (TIGR02574 family)
MALLTEDELAHLTPSERLSLISQLWDSLDEEQLALSSAQQTELERRLLSLDKDRREGISWEALKTELERRCPSCILLPLPEPPAPN